MSLATSGDGPALDLERQAPARRGLLPVAPEGIPFILVPLAAAAAIAPFAPLVALIPVVFAAAVAGFFRDPERAVPDDSRAIVSPADGKVMDVVADASGTTITIFLSVFNVHINRVPVAGTVRSVTYHPGKFLSAFRPEVPQVNERSALLLDTAHGPVTVVQIAGLIARRIVCRVSSGQALPRGERFGLIRFGSCTQLQLPAGAVPAVAKGDKVRGASTVIARWPAGGSRP